MPVFVCQKIANANKHAQYGWFHLDKIYIPASGKQVYLVIADATVVDSKVFLCMFKQ